MTTKATKTLGLLVCLLVAVTGCRAGKRFTFNGRVYDGATGAVLTGYTIELQYGSTKVKGTVDGEGRYSLGELPSLVDFTVIITANGYRAFLSHNAMFSDEGTSIGALSNSERAAELTEFLYFDATLFPEGFVSPAARIPVLVSNADVKVSGTVRFTPTTDRKVYTETVAGVGTQVWTNDRDLQAGSVVKTFSGGFIDLAEGDLPYGVLFNVAIYGVNGYAIADTGQTYRAGVSTNNTVIVLNADNAVALRITSKNVDAGNVVTDGRLVIVFNQAVALDPTVSKATYVEAIDAALTVDSPPAATPANAEKPNTTANDHGVDINIDGDRLTITWNESVALTTSDPAHPLTAVNYGALDQVRVRPANGAPIAGVALSTVTQLGLMGTPALGVTVKVPVREVRP